MSCLSGDFTRGPSERSAYFQAGQAGGRRIQEEQIRMTSTRSETTGARLPPCRNMPPCLNIPTAPCGSNKE